MNLKYQRLKKTDADKIWLQLEKLNWSQAELRRRTGIDRARIKLFLHHRYASLYTGARIAIAVAAGLAERF